MATRIALLAMFAVMISGCGGGGGGDGDGSPPPPLGVTINCTPPTINATRSVYCAATAFTPTHGETRRSWAVRVPVPELPPAFLAILDADGALLFIERISVPPL